jgi:UrcA family protein
MTFRSALAAAAALGALVTGAAAPAAAQGDSRSAVIRIADLNLDHAAGRAALQARIEVAARNLCSVYAGQNLTEWRLRRACQADVVADARDQLGLAAPTRAH